MCCNALCFHVAWTLLQLQICAQTACRMWDCLSQLLFYSNLFDLEFKMDLSFFAGGRCTTLSRSSMVGFPKRFQSLNLQVAYRNTSFARSQACNCFVNMYLKYIGSSEAMDLFTGCRVDEINTGFIIGDMNPSWHKPLILIVALISWSPSIIVSVLKLITMMNRDVLCSGSDFSFWVSVSVVLSVF